MMRGRPWISASFSCSEICAFESVLIASFSARPATVVIALPGEATADAADVEAEGFPPQAVLPLEVLVFATHCHAVVPIDSLEAAELLLIGDHAARGPPAR